MRVWCRATGVHIESARKNENGIDNHFNVCCMTHRPRPGFFGPRSGFVCIDSATCRVEGALAAAGARSREGVKQEEVRDIVALRRGLLPRNEASGFKEKPTHHPTCAMPSHPANADATIFDGREKKHKKKPKCHKRGSGKLSPSSKLIFWFAK